MFQEQTLRGQRRKRTLQKRPFGLPFPRTTPFPLLWRVLISLRAQILKNFKILKFSSELENFKRATHQTPIFRGEFWRSGLKISSEIEIFKRDWIFSRFGPLGFASLQISCPPFRNSKLLRRLWLSKIPCWKGFPAKCDSAGKFFPDSPAARHDIPAKVWALSGKENGCWTKNTTALYYTITVVIHCLGRFLWSFP